MLASFRVAARGLWRTPGFAITAIATLALGIGLSTAVFTVANAILLRGLPVADQDRLTVLWGAKQGEVADFPLSYNNAREFARRTRTLSQVALVSYYGAIDVPIRDGDRISRLQQVFVSGNFFDVLGARPVLGRAFHANDDRAGSARVAVLTYSAWQRRFNGDPRVIGRRIALFDNGISYTIVGVMPLGLEYPRGVDFWAPINPSTQPSGMQYVVVDLLGRLAPGASPVGAQSELTQFLHRSSEPAAIRRMHGVGVTLPRLILGDTRTAVLVFATAAALLLLITCINVVNLLLVRGLARVREIAVRAAIGASRARLVAQMLTENALLALIGGALGAGVAWAAVHGFVAVAPPELPRLGEVRVDGAALAGAIAITAVALLLSGLVPAIVASRAQLDRVLRAGSRPSAGRAARLAAEALVTAEVALALLVLSAAGLVAKSFIKLETVNLAFEPSHVLIAELTLRYDQYDSVTKQAAMLDQVLARVRSLPGVRAVSPVVATPFAGTHGWDARFVAEGQSAGEASANPMLNVDVVAPEYFAALGVPILRGRGFSDADREGSQNVVVISESAARHYWPGQNPIGKRFVAKADVSPNSTAITVVGVVPDTRYRDLREARASVYVPLRQSPFPFIPTTLAVRTSGPPAALVPALRRAISDAAPGVALENAAPFASFLSEPLAQPRLNALLLVAFACTALALAAVGIFGVMATMVGQRMRELGIRLALGATSSDLRRMVLRRGLSVAASGAAVGLCAAIAVNRSLTALLYDVAPTDLWTFAAASLSLLGVALLASLLPAHASTRVDPVTALRAED